MEALYPPAARFVNPVAGKKSVDCRIDFCAPWGNGMHSAPQETKPMYGIYILDSLRAIRRSGHDRRAKFATVSDTDTEKAALTS